jgi:protein-S-isoprenylcysteine O-methyltransferase Ste14
MTTYSWVIVGLWLGLVVYWGLAARARWRTSGSRWIWWREIAVRLCFFALIVQALPGAIVGNAVPSERLAAFNTGGSAALIGCLCAALGIGLAIMARAYLGQRWGVRAPSEEPELITTGPYALVRHPIYGGILLAMLGSMLAQSILWLVPLIVYGPHFIRSARREEQLLRQEFPQRYPGYMKRTKMLVPFVL